MTSRYYAALLSPLRWRAALVVLAVLLVSVELVAPETTRIGANSLVSEPNARASATTTPQTRMVYAAFNQHPLFFVSREPWMPPPPVVAAVSTAATPPPRRLLAPPQAYRLIGIVLSDGAGIALMQSPNGKILSIRQGYVLDGWNLTEIGRQGLHFEADGAVYNIGFAKHS